MASHTTPSPHLTDRWSAKLAAAADRGTERARTRRTPDGTRTPSEIGREAAATALGKLKGLASRATDNRVGRAVAERAATARDDLRVAVPAAARWLGSNLLNLAAAAPAVATGEFWTGPVAERAVRIGSGAVRNMGWVAVQFGRFGSWSRQHAESWVRAADTRAQARRSPPVATPTPHVPAPPPVPSPAAPAPVNRPGTAVATLTSGSSSRYPTAP